MYNKKTTYIVILLFFVGIICIILSCSISLAYTNDKEEVKEGQENILTARSENIVSIKLSFIGDSLIGSFRGENSTGSFRELLENNDYSFPYKNVVSIFKSDDYTIANGENVFTDNALSPIEKDHNPAYWYYAPSRFSNIYKESSIEVVSVMNNHTFDYGNEGYYDTITTLKETGVIVGDENPVILEKNDKRIGILCINLFSDYQYDVCVSNIKKIKNEVDYVIVYFHGGMEYSYKPNDDIVRFSHGFIDNGADLVIGAHPHVLEPIEIYKDKTIVYSLGSFLFGGSKYFVNRTLIYQRIIDFNLDTNELTETDNLIPCYLYTGIDGYESWIPSVIENEEEKQKVIDFMNNLVTEPI